jgi:hypothetical protein
MMFLLRTAFWIGVVLALLPSFGPKPSASQTPGLEATEAVTAASATVGDMIGFCARQPGACATGAHLASAIGQRAQAGAKMLYEMVGEKLTKTDPGGATGSVPASQPAEDVKLSQDTLTPADLAAGWRSPHHKDKGSI